MTVTWQVLPRVFGELFDANVQLVPQTSIICLSEGVELTVVGSTLRVDFRFFVFYEVTLHCPLAVYKTTITDLQTGFLTIRSFLVSLLTARAHGFVQLIPDVQVSVPAIYYNELPVCLAIFIHAVTQPAEAI